eukprot:scaffold192_cov114-Cylindrotheca_fusiformis.AAC.5
MNGLLLLRLQFYNPLDGVATSLMHEEVQIVGFWKLFQSGSQPVHNGNSNKGWSLFVGGESLGGTTYNVLQLNQVGKT